MSFGGIARASTSVLNDIMSSHTTGLSTRSSTPIVSGSHQSTRLRELRATASVGIALEAEQPENQSAQRHRHHQHDDDHRAGVADEGLIEGLSVRVVVRRLGRDAWATSGHDANQREGLEAVDEAEQAGRHEGRSQQWLDAPEELLP